MRRKTDHKPIIKKIVLVSVLVVLCLFIAIAVFLYSNYRKVVVTSAVKPSPSPEVPYVDAFNNLQPYTLVLLGYGGGTHAGGKLTDTMIVAHIIPKEEHIFLISIPRDVWVSLPANGDQLSDWKINAAYAIGSDDRGYPHKPLQFTGPAGGGEMTKYAVKQVTGLDVHNFAAIDFYGFTKSVDTLKGIYVKVEKAFEDPYYPIEGEEDNPCGKSEEEIAQVTATLSAALVEREFTCRYEHLQFTAGKTFMDGETALKYARSRHSPQDGGDFNRAARQRQVILAVRDRVISLDFFSKVIPFISTLGDHVRTDVDFTKMQEFLRYKDDLQNFTITNIALTDKNALEITVSSNGQSILAPKAGIGQWNTVHDWIQQEIQKSLETTPSAQVR